MARVSDFEIAEAEDDLLTAVLDALAPIGVTGDVRSAEWDTMSGLAVNVSLPDGRSATIMVQVD
jgi:hypothetical protein